MDVHIDVELVARVALAIIAAGIVVTKAIDALRARGTIEDGRAGEWNQVVAFVVALAGFLLKWIGFEGAIPQAEQLGVELSAVVVTAGVIAVLSWAFHYVVKKMEGSRIDVTPAPQLAEATPAPK